MASSEMLRLLETSQSETNEIEFKSEIDPASTGEIIEVIKDIIAIANSGGGGIVFGVLDDGSHSDFDTRRIKQIDLADLTNKIKKYTKRDFDLIEIERIYRLGKETYCFIVQGARVPYVFEEPGTYEIGDGKGKQKTAFSRGTLYFRHGSKSETASNYDLEEFVRREVDRIKDSWLGNIRKVVEAPIGHIVQVLPPDVKQANTPDAKPIRFTDSADAPAYRIDNPDKDCPYRPKEVLGILNERLRGSYVANHWDIHAIQEVYHIDQSRPDFFYKSKYGPKQFSMDFIDWIVVEYGKNKQFFANARAKLKRGI